MTRSVTRHPTGASRKAGSSSAKAKGNSSSKALSSAAKPKAAGKPKAAAKPKPAAKRKAATKPKPAAQEKVTPREASASSKPATAPSRNGIHLPMWLRPRFEGLLQRCQEMNLDDQLPDQLAVFLLEGLKEITQEELADHAASVGAVKLEQHRMVLGRALAKELDMREGLGGLGRDASGVWLPKVLGRALGLRFVDLSALKVTALARPLFEQAIGEVIERVRASASDTRTVVRQVLEAIDKVAEDAGLQAVRDRIVLLKEEPVPLEQAVKRALSSIQLSGAPGAIWERHGMSELAARAKNRNDWVSVSRGIWVGRREDASVIFDRIGLALGLAWSKLDAKSSAAWSRRLGEAGVVKTYNIGSVFNRGDALAHSKFGIGVVIGVEQGRVEVSFPDGVRKLASGA